MRKDAMMALVFDHDESHQSHMALALQEGKFDLIEIVERSDVPYRIIKAPDLIIVDEDLPPAGGLRLVSLLRRLTDAPIVVMGAGSADSLVQAVCWGADLYLERTVSNREFLVRIQALLRR